MIKDIDITACGYPSMDMLIECENDIAVGTTSIIKDYTDECFFGGCNVNIAAFCGRMGLRSAVLMKVGKNFESSGFKKFLESNNVDVSGVKVIEEDYTSCAYLISNPNGDHVTLFYPGAMDSKYPYSIDEDIVRRSKLGIITVGNADYNRDFMNKCIKNDVPVLLSMKWDTSAFPKDFLKELIHHCKIIMMNEFEKNKIETTFNLDDITDCFKSHAAEILVVTKGRRGSDVYVKDGESFKMKTIPIQDVGKPVDTAGVGDAYIAGFVKAYMDGKDVWTCGKLGTITSSFIVEKKGCLTNMKTMDEVKARYKAVYNEEY